MYLYTSTNTTEVTVPVFKRYWGTPGGRQIRHHDLRQEVFEIIVIMRCYDPSEIDTIYNRDIF
jgi:hypothetical protein